MTKSRTVGQVWPSLAVPNAGTLSLPLEIAASAALKKAGALQYENCPKSPLLKPFTQLFSLRLLPLAACRLRSLPLYPNHVATTALAGRVGTTGGSAGVVPLSITSG